MYIWNKAQNSCRKVDVQKSHNDSTGLKRLMKCFKRANKSTKVEFDKKKFNLIRDNDKMPKMDH